MEPRNDKPLTDASSADASLAHELRTRLARKTPPADFTARVLARVGREAPRAPSAAPVRVFPRPRWALAGALAASVAAAVYLSRETALRTPSPEAEAETQLLLSLQLAGEKFNKARDAVLRPGLKNPPEENPR